MFLRNMFLRKASGANQRPSSNTQGSELMAYTDPIESISEPIPSTSDHVESTSKNDTAKSAAITDSLIKLGTWVKAWRMNYPSKKMNRETIDVILDVLVEHSDDYFKQKEKRKAKEEEKEKEEEEEEEEEEEKEEKEEEEEEEK